MKLISATTHELSAIMEIIGHAQAYLASLGIDQWQNGYPNEEVIKKDIANGETYVVLDNTTVMATAMFSTRGEPTYKKILGQWLTDANAEYGVIHRMAVHDCYRSKGVAKFIFMTFESYLKERGINSMRIDTHQDNIGMQQLLNRMGYIYCGIIYLADGNRRLAYEKKLF